jgi:hypothetical protein
MAQARPNWLMSSQPRAALPPDLRKAYEAVKFLNLRFSAFLLSSTYEPKNSDISKISQLLRLSG